MIKNTLKKNHLRTGKAIVNKNTELKTTKMKILVYRKWMELFEIQTEMLLPVDI